MDQAILVNREIDQGTEVVNALEKAGLKLRIALMAHLDEYGYWRLVLSSQQFKAEGTPDKYTLVHSALAAAGIDYDHTPSLLLLLPTDPFVRELRRYAGKSKNTEGMRLRNQLFGNRFVDDAYVYLIR